MSSDIESKRKKIILITYCILCLAVSIAFLTCDVIKCYNKYLSGEYQLRAEATIVSLENTYFEDRNPYKSFGYTPIRNIKIGADVYAYNMRSNKCDIEYRYSDEYWVAQDVPVENLEISTDDNKLLSGEKRYSIIEYMQRIFNYTPGQIKNRFPGGALEYSIPQSTHAFAILLIFDFIYVIYKAISKTVDTFDHIMNGIMYVSSTFCLLISVSGMYFA